MAIVSLAVARFALSRWGALLVILIAAGCALLTNQRLEPVDDGEERLPDLVPSKIRLLLIAGAVLVVVLTGIAGRFRGDVSYDGNTYHLPPINDWTFTGYIHDVDDNFSASGLMNGYPKGAEAVTFVFVKAFGAQWLTALNLFYAPLGFLGIALLCRVLGAAYGDSLVFGALYLVVPTNLGQYTVTMVDAALASSAIALLALLAANLRSRVPRYRLTEAAAVGAAAGCTIAAKATGVVLAAVAIAAYLICRVALSRKGEPSKRWRRPFVWAAGSLVVAVVVGGFWYIKNYVSHGSPIYPMGLSLGGHTIWPGATLDEVVHDPAGWSRLNPNEKVWVDWSGTLDLIPRARHLGGLGVVWLAGCVPATLISLLLLKRLVPDPVLRWTYWFLAISVVVSFVSTPFHELSRYTIWILALGLPSLWLVLKLSLPAAPLLRRTVRYWVLACSVTMLGQASVVLTRIGVLAVADVELKGGGLTIVIPRKRDLLPLYPEMRSVVLAGILQGERRIGVGPRGLGDALRIYGQLSQPVGRRRLVPVTEDLDEAAVARLRAEPDLHFILWLTAQPVPAALLRHVTKVGAEGLFTYLQLRP